MNGVRTITGSKDPAYPMDSLQKSYRLPTGPRTLCIRTDMQHGHGGLGENPEEIHVFADTFGMKGVPLVKITAQGREGDLLWAKYSSKAQIISATLNFSRDSGLWWERRWESVPAEIKDRKVWARIPADATVFYLNLTDNRNLVVSTEYVQP